MIHQHILGDLFEGIKTSSTYIIIPHVANDIGAWGKGFVVPLAQHFPKAKEDYQEYIESQHKAPIDNDLLGDTVFTKVPPKIVIANMIAQKGIGTTQKPIRYAALVKCMETVRKTAIIIQKHGPLEIHAPMFGAGLAGGKWEVIEELINEIWRDIDTIIYSLK